MPVKNEFKEICKACGMCGGKNCAALQNDIQTSSAIPDKFPADYNGGIRFTSDAMDCALPISIDSHNGCSYSCLYCFAFSLQRAYDKNAAALRRAIKSGTFYHQFPLRSLEKFLARESKSVMYRKMYPMLDSGLPVQYGALGDPFDDLEIASGYSLKALELFIKYKVPVRISTKGAIALQDPKYRKVIEKNPENFWFAFSIISNSDEIIKKIDINAPTTSERLKAMKLVTDMGCWSSLRFRPFIPGVSDSYPGEPEAWRTLISRARQAGAMSISFEFIFLNSELTPRQAAMYRLMFRQMGNPNFAEEWKAMSDPRESCLRGTRKWKYEITMKVREHCHNIGMVFGISDPHFKEFNDYGCCCGIAPNHPTHGKWSRRQLTNVILEMKKAYDAGKPMKVNYLDWAPQWAHETKVQEMISQRDWHNSRVNIKQTFGDAMRNKWNNPAHPRSPFVYFEGVMRPTGIDKATQDLVYEYRPWDKDFDRDLVEPIKP